MTLFPYRSALSTFFHSISREASSSATTHILFHLLTAYSLLHVLSTLYHRISRSHGHFHFFGRCLQHLRAFPCSPSPKNHYHSLHGCTRLIYHVWWRRNNGHWLALSKVMAELRRCMVCIFFTHEGERLTFYQEG